MNIEELAEYLGVPVTTIYDWRVAGKGHGSATGLFRAGRGGGARRVVC